MLESPTFLSRCASTSSFAIVNERLYQLTDRLGEAEQYICLGNQQFEIVPSASIVDIELFERKIHEGKIFQFKKKYIAEALQQEIRSRYEIVDYDNAVRTMEFILYEVLPMMIDTAYELGDLLHVQKDDVKTGKQVVEELVAEELKKVRLPEKQVMDTAELKCKLEQKIEQEMPAPLFDDKNNGAGGAEKATATTSLGKVLHAPVYIYGQHAYELVRRGRRDRGEQRDKREQGDIRFHIDSKDYWLERSIPLATVEKTYQRILQQHFQREALGEMQAQVNLTQEKQRSAMERLAERQEMSYGNLGYLRSGTQFYVYWETAPFAMQNPLTPEQYHPFPAARIGVRVNYSNGAVHQNQAIVINPMVHPFLRDWRQGWQPICILDLSSNDSPDAFGIVRRISTAVNAFTNGLTEESLHRHGVLDENAGYFGRPLRESLDHAGRLSREEALRRGCRITNEWNLEGGVSRDTRDEQQLEALLNKVERKGVKPQQQDHQQVPEELLGPVEVMA